MKLPVKVILCYLISILAVFLIINVVGTKQIRTTVYNEEKAKYSKYAEQLADEYAGLYDIPGIQHNSIAEQLRRDGALIDARVWLVNGKGVVIIDTEGTVAYDIGLFSDSYLDKSFVENVSFGRIFPEPVMSFIAPVIYNYEVKGHICIHIPMSRIETRTTSYMDIVNINLLIVSAVLLAAFLVIYIIVAYPMRKIRNAALEFAKGHYDYPLNIKNQDEIGELAESVKYMVGEIRNVDDYQKKFIANVSHDFRSPLTSIKGYAEAMKDGTIPYELQGKYLNIILFEADRLTKLTSNLLDLNRMDSKGLMLEITSFDINQVIKNVAAAFEGVCSEKKIVIGLEFASFETYVDADMGRIQQVLYNLTDNAIKFSNPDSKVEIETEEKGSKVLVRVRDYGAGIPKESIKKIWERFYKIDTSRGKDKKGTGLGLSIVKEVITAHGENISVVSTEGVGTEFTFTLSMTI